MKRIENKIKVLLTHTLLLLLVVAIIFIYNGTSVLSLIYFLTIFYLLNKIFFKFDKVQLYTSFLFYIFVMLIIFFAQNISFPQMHGMNPIGMNADDLFFYHQASSTVPANLLFSPKSTQDLHPFSILLKIFTFPLQSLFKLLPLDFLFFNVIIISFLPSLVSRLSLNVTKNDKISRLVFWTTLICPFILMNSLILIRDGWTAVLLVSILLLLFEKKYIRMTILLLFLFYIRFAAGLQMVLILGIFFVSIAIDKTRNLRSLKIVSQFSLLLIPVITFISYIFLRDYIFEQLGGSGFLRLSFLETYFQNFNDSIYYRILQFPIIIRLPLGLSYFTFGPYFSEPFFNDGHFLPRTVLNTLFVLWNFVLVKYFISGAIVIMRKRDKILRAILYSFIINMLLLSQLSMQFRHKTMFMPLYYIIVSYGVFFGTKNSKNFGLIIGVILVIINVVSVLV